jgi:SAM-dependent methyltransferase
MSKKVIYKTDLENVDWQAMKSTLAADQFDNGRSPAQLQESFANSYAKVIAYAGSVIVGTARALSDGVCNAYIVDVWTLTNYRRSGIASKMMEILMDQLHGQHVYLFTDEAVEFYETLGFEAQSVGMGRVVGKWLHNQAEKPIAQEAYDELAEAYAALVDTKAHNAYYERPATLSLLPDVKGKRVLDAGCGPGAYAEWLVNKGAQVVAFDANEKMVKLARERLGDKAKIFHANLEHPLDFLKDDWFELVVSPLVMDYVKDWESVFAEFYRVLRAGGNLVFSMEHPYAKFFDHRESSSYFELDLVDYVWTGFGMPVQVPSYRRPLSEVINPLVRAGFTLEQILEPKPTEEFRQKEPEDYEKLIRNPGFMCVRAIKV